MSAEEVYLFDKRTSIETTSFVCLRGHCNVAETRACLRLEKADVGFQLSYHGIGMPQLFITGGTKRPRAKDKTKTYPRERGRERERFLNDRTPYGHPQRPLGVCKPNEKQKHSFLAELRA